MKRIYFLSPNIHSTKSIVAELKHSEISDDHIYVVGKDHMGLQDAHMHEAGLFQTTDVLHALERGAAVGASIGFLSGLGIMVFPTGLIIGGGAVLAMGLVGTGLGAWISTMIGISEPNPDIEKYERGIDAGELLIIVDINQADEERTREQILKHHPEASIEAIPLLQPHDIHPNVIAMSARENPRPHI